MEKNDVEFTESDWLPSYYEVDSVAPFINKGWVKKGFCWIQDIAAGFAPTILDPQSDESIYDFCAAPGTKTVLLSSLMNGEGEILAVDISSERLDRLAQNAMDFQAENVKVRRADVRELTCRRLTRSCSMPPVPEPGC
ncbi:MAG: methyltransferase domain-containing protein [Balneolaceae bacterium]|nr:methyltransferase domain-containing protein [Balneolaceae bacterium]